MSNIRLPFSLAAGALFSAALFLALFKFVNVPLDIGPLLKSEPIAFTRQIPDTPVEVERARRIERPKPPVVPGSNSTKIIGDPTGPDRPTFTRASFELPGTPIELPPRGHGDPVGMDRDVIPVVRMTPDYPAHAAANGVEGWVQIQFDVTTAGTVRNPIVVASQPRGEFEAAALKTIARWRYNPRIDGGVAVERVGLQTVIRFELDR